MEFRNLDSDQLLTILAVIGLLSGLLLMPLIVQEIYGINAVKTAFVVVVIYAIINWWMKKAQTGQS